jgi:hypothetical protein
MCEECREKNSERIEEHYDEIRILSEALLSGDYSAADLKFNNCFTEAMNDPDAGGTVLAEMLALSYIAVRSARTLSLMSEAAGPSFQILGEWAGMEFQGMMGALNERSRRSRLGMGDN